MLRVKEGAVKVLAGSPERRLAIPGRQGAPDGLPPDYDCPMAPTYEFHLARSARERYGFGESILGLNGRLLVSHRPGGALTGIAAARSLTDRIYAVEGRSVPASEIFAAALIEEILHLVLRRYDQEHPGSLVGLLATLQGGVPNKLSAVLLDFTTQYPPTAVFRKELAAEAYLAGSTAGISNQRITIEEILLVDVADRNLALEPYRDLFDAPILRAPDFGVLIRSAEAFFKRIADESVSSGGSAVSLLDELRAAGLASPYSLEGQLGYLAARWHAILPENWRDLILRAQDLAREEAVRSSGPRGEPRGEGLPEMPATGSVERYSLDRDWMPRLVLMAKNTYVWLEQLSRKYGRYIKILADVPDEELDLLARRGITGLWLIGLWERSSASRRIKQWMGQPDAVASAYSLHSYEIASDLGGWQALQDLRERARARGIRLSADMVPNHMGIDSAWVIEHPDWFLSLAQPPYPAYVFGSGNLCDDGRVDIRIEDHYYDHSDAAVVFQRRDSSTGDTRYIYHGNDGTSLPWNDTAQLDYSRADVREAVIQTILHVARNFPIIRFDAAMTLAREHIQRLWFPAPGAGGAIPSRSEHGLTQEQFDAAVPHEFWREVVDRVAAEVPDTLLLAEAFWLLEGYFVRTLGMHRVYNSAFMHMLRDEDNAKYRELIKSTLRFDPQILKRYVNFMSNPDEKTAAEQFGNGGKYFGVCTLLATLPGLPMFGHGQVEGFREKYGMEYRFPKWEEQSDAGLIGGHEWKIFPLLKRRYLFSDVEEFELFTFITDHGSVNDDVFAYSNRHGPDRAVVFYNNRLAETIGRISVSDGVLHKATGEIRSRSLAEALDIPKDGYAIFWDQATHQQYIRDCGGIWSDGLFVQLGAYGHHVFLDWQFVDGPDWAELCQRLSGKPVASMKAELAAMKLVVLPTEPSGPAKAAGKPRQVRRKPKLTVIADRAGNPRAKHRRLGNTKPPGRSGAVPARGNAKSTRRRRKVD